MTDREKQLTEAIEALLLAIGSVTYADDGRRFSGVRGDTDVTDDFADAMAKVRDLGSFVAGQFGESLP